MKLAERVARWRTRHSRVSAPTPLEPWWSSYRALEPRRSQDPFLALRAALGEEAIRRRTRREPAYRTVRRSFALRFAAAPIAVALLIVLSLPPTPSAEPQVAMVPAGEDAGERRVHPPVSESLLPPAQVSTSLDCPPVSPTASPTASPSPTPPMTVMHAEPSASPKIAVRCPE